MESLTLAIIKPMADEKAEKKDEAAEKPAGPKKLLGMPMLQAIIVLANVLIMLGGMGYIVWASLIYKKPPITEPQAVKEITKKVEKATETTGKGVFTETYQEMTITLDSQKGGRNRYATVEVVLLCGSEECLTQVKGNRAKIEDAIQSTISSRSFSELASLEVKFRLKHELVGKVNSFLKEVAVVDVLFTTFLVQ
jgi:flagellar FliL protein